ncbi:MAG: thioredoxin family protein, partial [Dehalococcoidia bacterium]
TGLSRKLHLEVMDFYSENQAAKDAAVERIPAIIMTANGTSNVKFYGIPMGYEFTAILEGLVTLSRGVSPLSLDTRKKLKRIKADVHIKVFVTPNCGYSPQVARLAHAMAMDNPRIAADVVEVQEFPLLGQQYMVANVPRTVINDRVQFVGAVPESVFVDKVLEAVAAAPDGQKSATLAIAPELGPYTRPAASRSLKHTPGFRCGSAVARHGSIILPAGQHEYSPTPPPGFQFWDSRQNHPSHPLYQAAMD